ncbi:hypothetical protein PC116_g28718 [Phytophthora cactorum]|nr:hypothetical protein PC116_g28718 [Phytophthora cactorum]
MFWITNGALERVGETSLRRRVTIRSHLSTCATWCSSQAYLDVHSRRRTHGRCRQRDLIPRHERDRRWPVGLRVLITPAAGLKDDDIIRLPDRCSSGVYCK